MRWQAGSLRSRCRRVWGGLLFWSVLRAPGGSLSMCFQQIKSVWASPSPRASTCGIGIIHTFLDAGRFEQSGRSCQWTELHVGGGSTGCQRMTRLALVTAEDNLGCEYYKSIVLIVFIWHNVRVVCTDSVLLRFILGSNFCVVSFFCRYKWKWVKMQLFFSGDENLYHT